MKKNLSIIFITIAFIFTSNSVICQERAKTYMLGATTSFQLVSYDDFDDATLWNLNINGGYFLKNNFMLGGGIGYMDSSDISALVQLDLKGRFYMNKFFTGAGLSIIFSNGNSTPFANIEIGFSFLIAKNLAFEPTVSYLLDLEGDWMTGNIFNSQFGFAFYF